MADEQNTDSRDEGGEGRGRGGDRGDRGGKGGPGGPKKGGRRGFGRRKVCRFCMEKTRYIDWKDTRTTRMYVGERGKIVPRRISGTCSGHQRQLKVAVERARNMALLPVGEANRR
jgi:small subunit ribosomal protein S18